MPNFWDPTVNSAVIVIRMTMSMVRTVEQRGRRFASPNTLGHPPEREIDGYDDGAALLEPAVEME